MLMHTCYVKLTFYFLALTWMPYLCNAACLEFVTTLDKRNVAPLSTKVNLNFTFKQMCYPRLLRVSSIILESKKPSHPYTVICQWPLRPAADSCVSYKHETALCHCNVLGTEFAVWSVVSRAFTEEWVLTGRPMVQAEHVFQKTIAVNVADGSSITDTSLLYTVETSIVATEYTFSSISGSKRTNRNHVYTSRITLPTTDVSISSNTNLLSDVKTNWSPFHLLNASTTGTAESVTSTNVGVVILGIVSSTMFIIILGLVGVHCKMRKKTTNNQESRNKFTLRPEHPVQSGTDPVTLQNYLQVASTHESHIYQDIQDLNFGATNFAVDCKEALDCGFSQPEHDTLEGMTEAVETTCTDYEIAKPQTAADNLHDYIELNHGQVLSCETVV